jgi:hypothetical protein
LTSAWTISTGSSHIVVSTLDSGLKLDHPEFTGRLWVNPNEIPNNNRDDDNNRYVDDIVGYDFVNKDNDPTDDHGHGTNVTGIIGANGNNGIGYAGVDWKCKLMTCKVLDNKNSGYNSNITNAIYYSVHSGAHVINMSIQGSNYSNAMENAVNFATNNNRVVVAAMGNWNSSTTSYPAAYLNTISVGATDVNHYRANPFTWGGGSNFGNHIDVTAPGNRIYGLRHNSNGGVEPHRQPLK